MADLINTVWVKDEQLQPVSFAPGDEIPGWALEQMGDHCFVDGERPKATKTKGKSNESGDDQSPPGDASPYDGLSAADLKAKVAERNDGRDDAWKVKPSGTSKAAMAAALTVDDRLQDAEYDAVTVDDLKAEIGRRNADRDDDAHISTSGNKAELVEALRADDDAEPQDDGGE